MGTPNYPKDLASEWTKLRRDVKNAFTSANLRTGMAKIGAKVIEVTGSLILNAGAKFIAKYDNNVDAFIVDQGFLGSTPVGRVLIQRYNGTRLFEVFGGEDDPGFFSFKDMAENIIISEDAGSGQGLARPWLPYNATAYADILLPRTMVTSSTFTGVQHVAGYMQHPRAEIFGWLRTDGSDVAEIRVRNPNTGTVLYTSSGNTSTWKSMTFNHQDYEFGNSFGYDVEIRRTSGTSTGVGFTLTRAHGIQS